jgi:hypothetical protein
LLLRSRLSPHLRGYGLDRGVYFGKHDNLIVTLLDNGQGAKSNENQLAHSILELNMNRDGCSASEQMAVRHQLEIVINGTSGIAG